MDANKYCVAVDGKIESCGLKPIKDRKGDQNLLGVSVGHKASTPASMSPRYIKNKEPSTAEVCDEACKVFREADLEFENADAMLIDTATYYQQMMMLII